MSLELTRDPALPPLAWAVRWDGHHARLLAGDAVEVSDVGWIEGAWSGPFDAMDPRGRWLAGTAGRVDDEGLTLTPPFHSLDCVYAVARSGATWASNSLAFLLEASGASLRSDQPRYLTEFARVIDGLPAHRISLPLANGEHLEVLHLLPVTFDRSGDHRVGDLPEIPRLTSFHEYRSFLDATASDLIENASDRRRRRPMRPVTTVSSGYDSPAVAAIVRAFGVTESLTITEERGRRDRSGEEDSGAVVAAALGMTVEVFARDARWSEGGTPVIAEFLATGMSGEEVPLRRLERALVDSLLFTGYYGDKVWGRSVGTDPLLRRSDLGGSSLTEFRLRTGWCHVPLPFLGAVAHPDIAAISASEDLRPWSVGGGYDRPIARRIAEAASVPREAFGQRKLAVTALAGRRRIEDPDVRAGILALRARAGRTARLRHAAEAVVGRLVHDPRWFLRRVVTKLRGRPPRRGDRAPFLQRRAGTLHGSLAGWAFLWAVEEIARERYRAPVARCGIRGPTAR